MKVSIVYPDKLSEKGISNYSIDLIKYLKKQEIEVDEITYTQHKPWTLFKKIIKYNNITHIQHEYNLLSFWGIPFLFLYLLLPEKPIITTMHTVISPKETFEGEKLKTFLRKRFYKIQNWIIKKLSEKVIVHSDYFKEILINEYKFPVEKVVVLPHAINEEIKKFDKEESKKELGLDGNVYLLIGTLNPYHDYESVVRQAKEIGKTIAIVTNDKPLNYRNKEVLKKSLESLKKAIEGNEEFVRLDTSDITSDDEKWWKYFSACDLVILPYKFGVGCGIFSDAISMRKPCVTSKVPYFESIRKNYGCIKLTDNNFPRTIRKAMIPENYEKMVKECERYIQENGLTPISKKYKKLYEDLE